MAGVFSIRKAVTTDAPLIHALHTRSVKELCKEHYTSMQLEGWLKNRTPAGYLPGIEAGDMFVALLENLVVGFGHAVHGEVCAVYVDPKYVGQGVGEMLLLHGINMARQTQQAVIHLDSTINAEGFYAKYGFITVRRKTLRRGDATLPAVEMELRTTSQEASYVYPTSKDKKRLRGVHPLFTLKGWRAGKDFGEEERGDRVSKP